MRRTLRIARLVVGALALAISITTCASWAWSYRRGHSVTNGTSILGGARGGIYIVPLYGPLSEGWSVDTFEPSDLPERELQMDVNRWLPYRHATFMGTSFAIVPHWVLAVAAAGVCIVVRPRRLRGPAPGLCPACGYDLRATPDRCPECGHVPAGDAPPPPSDAPGKPGG